MAVRTPGFRYCPETRVSRSCFRNDSLGWSNGYTGQWRRIAPLFFISTSAISKRKLERVRKIAATRDSMVKFEGKSWEEEKERSRDTEVEKNNGGELADSRFSVRYVHSRSVTFQE